MSDCFHAAGLPGNTNQGHPAAYNSPRIKLLQLRATLSDEDNVIAKQGTQGDERFINQIVITRVNP